ncbi:MAG: oxaloacetate-decarboxylating malate dehydrogenase, partial [Rhodothermales bacterium]|nr:oxaloacetate-decarboxylating malate dehydrogenase [Rhodothermales bacterium]
QLEDFANTNAFRLLDRYRDTACLFDDDIQGTGSVVLSGLLSSARITGRDLEDQTFLFLGAGEAGIGIASMIVAGLVDAGLDTAEARARCWFMDSKGLVVKSRSDLQAHKKAYAQDAPFLDDLLQAVDRIKPTALIGVSGVPRSFRKAVVQRMAELNERPIIFALSNPTSKSECTARQAYQWTDGKAVFASGSPFDPVSVNRKTFVPGQANNAYVFPGVGLGAIASQSRSITDKMFFIAAKVLSEEVTEDDLKLGRIYPPFDRIREVSARIATAVSEEAYRTGSARRERPDDIYEEILEYMFDPAY